MKHVLIAMALAFAALSANAAPKLPDIEQARATARSAGKPLLAVWYFSEQAPDAVKKAYSGWEGLGSELPGIVVSQYDELPTIPAEKRAEKTGVHMYNLPCALLYTPEGDFFASVDRNTTLNAEKLAEQVKKLSADVPKFAELLKKAAEADSGNNKAAAEIAGKALALMPAQDVSRQRRLVEIINRNDPDDTTGMRAMYTIDHLGMYRQINLILTGGDQGGLSGANRRFNEALEYVDRALAHKELKGERRQQWMAGRAYVMREKLGSQPGDWASKDYRPLVQYYRDIAKLDPKSQYGIGAAAYADYWDKEAPCIITSMFYDSRYARKRPTAWHVDVTKSIKGAGTYEFKLVPTIDNAMEARDFRLFIDGREVAKSSEDPNANVRSATFKVPAVKKGAKVEVRLINHCKDHWLASSGFIEMNKVDAGSKSSRK